MPDEPVPDHERILDGTVSEARYRAVFEHCSDAMLLTEHNLTFYQALMQGMREAIGRRRFAEWAAEFRRGYLE